MKKLLSILTLTSVLSLTGCATILGDKTQSLPISTTPEGAHFKIIDETGKTVHEGTTPATVTLPKHDGSYFGKKTYSVTFDKEGYQTTTYPLSTSPNAKYILGNFIFGGLVGWLIVDPLNGGMYDIHPASVSKTLNQ
ncbi:hypothetical protein [Glaesserella sp.]|uniref:hypothetical protein n=1 Tax=Glaesserella sp. TaxID=2094731 RepID=UPI0035A0C27A